MKRALFATLTAVVVAGVLAGPALAAGPGCFDYIPKDLFLSSVDHQGGVSAFPVGNLIYQVGFFGTVEKVDISDRTNPVVTASTQLSGVDFVGSCQMRQVSDYLLVFWTGYRNGWIFGTYLTVLNLSSLYQLADVEIPAGTESFYGSDMRLRYVYLAKGSEGLLIYDVQSNNPAEWELVDTGKFDVGRAADIAFLGENGYVVSGDSATLTVIDAADPAHPAVDQTFEGTVFNARFVSRMNDKIVAMGGRRVGIYDFFLGAGSPELSVVNIASGISAYTRVGYDYFVSTSEYGPRIYKVDMSSPWEIESNGYFTPATGGGVMCSSGSDVIVNRSGGTDIYDTELFTGILYLHSYRYMSGEWTYPHGLVVDGDYAYLTLADDTYYTNWLRIFDISNKRDPVELADYEFDLLHALGVNVEFLVASDHLFTCARYQDGVRVHDLTDKTNPAYVTTVQTQVSFSSVRSWVSDGRYVYFASHRNTATFGEPSGKIHVLDIDNPAAPMELFPNDYLYLVQENDDLTYLAIDTTRNVLYASTEYGLDAYDMNPSSGELTMVATAEFTGSGPLDQVTLGDGDVYLTTDPTYGSNAVYSVNTANLQDMTFVEVSEPGMSDINDLSFDSELYVASDDEHMSIYLEGEGWPEIHSQQVGPFQPNTALSIEAREDFVAYLEGPRLVIAPKLCPNPQTILTGSVRGEGAGEVLDLFHWLFTWKTYGYTDPALDFVTVTDPVGTPLGCQVGTLELTAATPGVEASVSYGADGWYTHTFAWHGATCVAYCNYDFTVGSMDETSGGHVLAIGRCPRDIDIDYGKETPPDAVSLAPANPNPFNPMTTLRYHVPAGAQRMALRIYDVQGRLVRQLVEGPANSGWMETKWDGTDDHGAKVSSGLFFAKFDVDRTTQVQKLMMLK